MSIREAIPSAEIGQKIEQIFGELMAHFSKRKVVMTGPPFAIYHSYDNEKTDMDVGFPVAEPQKGEGRVKSSVLPGGKVVTATHIGPYEKAHETYAEMQKWIAEKGLKPKKMMWERHMNGSDTVKDPTEYITVIFWPIE